MGDEIIDFYEGKPNRNGRKLDEMLNWDRMKLEHTHNYIQHMFPIVEPSYFNRDIPKLTEETIQEFRKREDLKKKLVISFITICRFWGFDVSEKDGNVIVSKSKDFDEYSKNWFEKKNHNHLRMTRVIHSLKTLGLEHCAKAFYNALMEVEKENSGIINSVTLQYWEEAIKKDEK